MEQPSSHRSIAAVATVAFSLALVGPVVAPALSGASTHGHRAQAQRTLVKIETSKEYGKILVNASGRTLYFLTSETEKSLKCTGGCIGLWPLLLTKGKPEAGTGIVAKELGTLKRGSSLQVTYYGHPLYLYSGDKAAGQANGEGIAAFGGWWYVLSRTGSPVKAALTSSSGGSGGGW
jgi:predicted lipoprotein with Yx(FWY)xxD motif